MNGGSGYRYRAWDGRQATGAFSPDDLLDQLGERLLDEPVEPVLNDALHRGLETPDGERLPGLDDLRAGIRNRAEQIAEEDLANDARSMLDASRAAGSEGLSGATERLLESLAANPAAARRLLDQAGAGVRAELEQRLGQAGPLGRQGALGDLLQLHDLEASIRRVRRVADVEEIDFEQLQRLLAPDIAGRFRALAGSLGEFEASGFIRPESGGLSPRAVQQLGAALLKSAFDQIRARATGDHDARTGGGGLERAGTTRIYQFGDPFDLDLSQTVLSAVKRSPGTPVRLTPDDMTIFEREETGRVATVLAIDLSRSMGERGYLRAAKRLALALTTLISTRFPRDQLQLLAFSNEARSIDPAEITSLTWDRYAYGTNIHDAIAAGRQALARYAGLQRNLILITDGEPTAYRDESGEVRYCEPPTPDALAATYAEAVHSRRQGIRVTIALLTRERRTVKFAEDLSRQAGGTLMLTEPDDLSVVVMLGYGRSRR